MARTVPPTTSDRFLAAIRAILRQEDANRTYRGIYEYAVQAVEGNGSTADLLPTDSTIGLPGLTKVPMRAGLPGSAVQPGKGSLLAVGFLNGDPTRPIVIPAFDSSTAQNVTLNTGTGTSEHLMTSEATVNLIWQTFVALSAVLTSPWTGGTVAGAIVAALNTALAASSTTSITLFSTALDAALAVKAAAGTDAAGAAPGVGCPNLQGG